MARGRSNFKMGMVEMIVLFLLKKQDLYGYQLTTLYPTLYKLLKNQYISDREVSIGKRRVRVYYHIEDSGKDRLKDLLDDYREVISGAEMILSCEKLPEEENHD